MTELELGPVWLSLRLATVTVVVLLVLATPLAWWLAFTRSRARTVIEAVVALPLVLPPTVLGFYLLVLLGPAGAIGRFWVQVTDSTLTFSFVGLVVASVIYSFPLALRGYVSAIVLTFAHTLGEFGVVLMVGGNIPDRTKVISIAIYEHVETLRYTQAHVLAAGLLAFSFVVLLSVYMLNRRMPLVRT
jgi:molybdate transport system permease protein